MPRSAPRSGARSTPKASLRIRRGRWSARRASLQAASRRLRPCWACPCRRHPSRSHPLARLACFGLPARLGLPARPYVNRGRPSRQERWLASRREQKTRRRRLQHRQEPRPGRRLQLATRRKTLQLLLATSWKRFLLATHPQRLQLATHRRRLQQAGTTSWQRLLHPQTVWQRLQHPQTVWRMPLRPQTTLWGPLMTSWPRLPPELLRSPRPQQARPWARMRQVTPWARMRQARMRQGTPWARLGLKGILRSAQIRQGDQRRPRLRFTGRYFGSSAPEDGRRQVSPQLPVHD